MKLLLVDDERDLVAVVEKILKKNNYSVDTAFNGLEALTYLEYGEYDCVVLDVMMPKLDGISVVKRLREKGNNVPVLLLTAKAEVDDRVLGLDTGADDYLTKPFATKELLARIRAMTRRKESKINSYTMMNTTINPTNYEMTAVRTVRLTNKEFQMMELLILNPNSLISTERFMESIWGYDTEAEINVVWVFISALRKKLAEIGSELTVKAVRGLGYKLEAKNG